MLQDRDEQGEAPLPRELDERRAVQELVKIARTAIEEAFGKRIEDRQAGWRPHVAYSDHSWTGLPVLWFST
jgi:hypothetical protein